MQRSAVYALVAACLFGISTPLAKMLLGEMPPLALAGLLYAGSGAGLLVVLALRRSRATAQTVVAMPVGTEWRWLGGAILFGGIAGPVALMYGLVTTPASSASLLLNLEGVLTALFAWFLFRENFDRRVAFGMLSIVAGGVALAWTTDSAGHLSEGALLVIAACLCWALDNNLTRRASTADAVFIAALKGVFAGIVNLILALLLHQRLPGPAIVLAAATVGLLGYGASLVLFVLALRNLGSARTSAYFSVAPFFGALVAIVLQGDAITPQLVVAGGLMGLGVSLHLVERHAHTHVHERQEHTHSHRHDEHHRHSHDFPWNGREPHTHAHVHQPLVHAHAHYPDVHHRHSH